MNPIISPRLSSDAEVRRIEMLYGRLPSSIVVALIGIFISFLVLFEITGLNLLKGWAAFMLSGLAMRVWIWYMFSKAEHRIERIHRWEWLFAVGACVTAVGWGALFGSLYPPATHPDAQMFVTLMVVVTAFTGSVFLALSNSTFWLFILPTLMPALLHYASTLGHDAQWPIIAAASCIAVFIIVQRTLYQSAAANLERSTETELLLAEQQAIFDSSPVGIAVISNKQLVKCNVRLGELLGRRIKELTTSPIDEHFADGGEAEKFFAESAGALNKGPTALAQGIYRLRRADGSHFWAELSGRRMAGGAQQSIWMISDITSRLASDRRSRPREPQWRPEMQMR